MPYWYGGFLHWLSIQVNYIQGYSICGYKVFAKTFVFALSSIVSLHHINQQSLTNSIINVMEKFISKVEAHLLKAGFNKNEAIQAINENLNLVQNFAPKYAANFIIAVTNPIYSID